MRSDSSMPLLRAGSANSSTTSSNTCCGSNTTRSNCSLPASILEKSSTSLITRSSDSAEPLMASR